MNLLRKTVHLWRTNSSLAELWNRYFILRRYNWGHCFLFWRKTDTNTNSIYNNLEKYIQRILENNRIYIGYLMNFIYESNFHLAKSYNILLSSKKKPTPSNLIKSPLLICTFLPLFKFHHNFTYKTWKHHTH